MNVLANRAVTYGSLYRPGGQWSDFRICDFQFLIFFSRFSYNPLKSTPSNPPKLPPKIHPHNPSKLYPKINLHEPAKLPSTGVTSGGHIRGLYKRIISEFHIRGSYSRVISGDHIRGSYSKLILHSRVISEGHIRGSYLRIIFERSYLSRGPQKPNWKNQKSKIGNRKIRKYENTKIRKFDHWPPGWYRLPYYSCRHAYRSGHFFYNHWPAFNRLLSG